MKYSAMVLSLMLLSGMALAQEAGSISLQFTDADIVDVLTSVSQQAQVSVVADATVKGKVGCGLTGITVAQALDAICKPNKLEWYKAYTGVGAEKPNASELFKLMDALKDLGGAALICEDPKSKVQTVFVPSAGEGSVDNSAIAAQLKLKEIYMIRAIPDPAAIQAEKDKAKTGSNLAGSPPSDPQAAAQQVWGYFQQMPQQQAFDTMHEFRRKFFDGMSGDQRRAYFEQMKDRWSTGGERDGRKKGGRDGQPRQPKPKPVQ